MQLIKPNEICEALGISIAHLHRLRMLGCPHLRVSQRVIRYNLADVLAWLDAQKEPLNSANAPAAGEGSADE